MSERIETNVLVVGGGPGGYVAAIRCGQLGLKTTLVEADRLGGTCLIRGCIPSKAMIHVAGKFEAMLQHVGAGKLGIRLDSAPLFDLGGAVDWKETVVDKLNGGVAALLKKAKVRVVQGQAVFTDAKNCSVQSSEGPVQISAEFRSAPNTLFWRPDRWLPAFRAFPMANMSGRQPKRYCSVRCPNDWR